MSDNAEALPSYEDFAPPSYKSKEAVEISTISLDLTDRLRLIGVSPQLIDNMRIAINQNFGSNSIQEECELCLGTHEFKLVGNPWIGQCAESVTSRTLVIAVLKCMSQNGWNFLQGADISKSDHDTDTLFFESGKADPGVQIFAISFNMTDRIRVIGAPDTFNVVVRDAVLSVWKSGIQNMRRYHNAFEIKLFGNPWTTVQESQVITARILLCKIISKFSQLGYRLYASIDMSMGDITDGRDLDSFFFRKVNTFWP